MSQPIYYDSSEVGAPTLNNAAGSLIEVLRACLVNGFGAKAVTSIAVAAGVATVTCASHGFKTTAAKLVQISGAAEAGLNGNKQPLTADTNTFTFSATGVPDGTYTGTISARRAPAGWAVAFEEANVAIFARVAPQANAQMLLINDSHANGSTATDARVQIVETATSITEYTGAIPGTPGYWTKGINNSTAKQWAIVADDQFFWFFPTHGTSASVGVYTMTGCYFGDVIAYNTPDAYSTVITHAIAVNSGTSGGIPSGGGHMGSQQQGALTGFYISRSLAATSGRAYRHVGPCVSESNPIIGGAGGTTNLTALVIHEPVWCVDSDNIYRGEIPGLAAPLAATPYNTGGQLQVLSPVELSDPYYLVVLHTSHKGGTGGTTGTMLINLSNWRR